MQNLWSLYYTAFWSTTRASPQTLEGQWMQGEEKEGFGCHLLKYIFIIIYLTEETRIYDLHWFYSTVLRDGWAVPRGPLPNIGDPDKDPRSNGGNIDRVNRVSESSGLSPLFISVFYRRRCSRSTAWIRQLTSFYPPQNCKLYYGPNLVPFLPKYSYVFRHLSSITILQLTTRLCSSQSFSTSAVTYSHPSNNKQPNSFAVSPSPTPCSSAIFQWVWPRHICLILAGPCMANIWTQYYVTISLKVCWLSHRRVAELI